MNNSAFRPDFWDVVFSLKTFAAAMLALFVAFCFDLQTPAWAMTTVYIVANPLSGASTSKAVYRLIGTVVGGTASVVMVPNLVNAPELLTLAVALWVGLCLTLSLLDRSPRGYSFMLAGYTAALTSLPLVDSPDTVFTYTTSRVVEISIGIICTAVISRVVFPRHAGTVLAKRVETWLDDASRLVDAALAGRSAEPDFVTLRRKLGVDAADIRLFTTHVVYDTSEHQATVGWSRALQARMVTLLPIVSGITDVKAAMSLRGIETSADISSSTARIIAAMEARRPIAEEEATILATSAAGAKTSEWEQLLKRNFAVRVGELVDVWNDCVVLRDVIVSNKPAKRAAPAPTATENTVHVDIGMAIFSGLSAALAIVLGCTFWIATGWSSGAGMPLIAGILMSFFAAQDNPTPVVRKFMKFSLYAMILSFVFVFAVMPSLTTFPALAFGLAFLFVPLGLLIAKPATFLPGMAICTNIPTMLTLQTRPVLDLTSFLNSNTATIIGTVLTIYIASLVKAVGAEWSAKRVLRAGWADVNAIARRSRHGDARPLMHRMLDRFALVAPRLASIPSTSAVLEADILKDMRVGINAMALQRHKHHLPAEEEKNLDEVLGGIESYYDAKRREKDASPSPLLLKAIDASLMVASQSKPSKAFDSVRVAAVSLRYSLFPNAPSFEGEAEPLRQAAE